MQNHMSQSSRGVGSNPLLPYLPLHGSVRDILGDTRLRISMSYTKDGVFHDHLKFSVPRIASHWYLMLKRSGAEDIQVKIEQV